MKPETQKMLEDDGWVIECESPFEIRHKDGSFASQQAAHCMVAYLENLAEVTNLKNTLAAANARIMHLEAKKGWPVRLDEELAALVKIPWPKGLEEGVSDAAIRCLREIRSLAQTVRTEMDMKRSYEFIDQLLERIPQV